MKGFDQVGYVRDGKQTRVRILYELPIDAGIFFEWTVDGEDLFVDL